MYIYGVYECGDNCEYGPCFDAEFFKGYFKTDDLARKFILSKIEEELLEFDEDHNVFYHKSYLINKVEVIE